MPEWIISQCGTEPASPAARLPHVQHFSFSSMETHLIQRPFEASSLDRKPCLSSLFCQNKSSQKKKKHIWYSSQFIKHNIYLQNHMSRTTCSNGIWREKENGSYIKRLQTVTLGWGQNAKTEKLITQNFVRVFRMVEWNLGCQSGVVGEIGVRGQSVYTYEPKLSAIVRHFRMCCCETQ